MLFTVLFEYNKYLHYIFIGWSVYIVFCLFGMYCCYQQWSAWAFSDIYFAQYNRLMQRAMYVYILFSVAIAYIYIYIYIYVRFVEKAFFEVLCGYGILLVFKKVDSLLRIRWMHLYQQLGHLIIGIIVILLCIGY